MNEANKTEEPSAADSERSAVGRKSIILRVIATVVPYAVGTYVVGAVAGLITLVIGRGAEVITDESAGSLLVNVARLGYRSLVICLVGLFVAMVMLAGYIDVTRKGIVRGAGLLGALSGLTAGVVGGAFIESSQAMTITRYAIGVGVLLICLVWKFSRRVAAETGANDTENNPNGSET